MRVRALQSFSAAVMDVTEGDELDVADDVGAKWVEGGLVVPVRQGRPVQTATTREPEKAITRE